MNHHLKSDCEGVDAAVFSGDVLYDDESRTELKDYIARWQRAITEHECQERKPSTQDGEPIGVIVHELSPPGPPHWSEPRVLAQLNVGCELPAGTPVYGPRP